MGTHYFDSRDAAYEWLEAQGGTYDYDMVGDPPRYVGGLMLPGDLTFEEGHHYRGGYYVWILPAAVNAEHDHRGEGA